MRNQTFWRRNSNSLEKFGIVERKFNDFSEFADLIGKTTDFRVGDVSRIFVGHVVNQRVDFSWKISHNRQRGHIESHSSSCLELILVHLPSATDDVSGTVCRLNTIN